MTGPFHPRELSGADDDLTVGQLAETQATARDLEANLSAADVHPSTAFVDRVMATIASEPLPQPAIAAGSALRGGRLGAMTAALADSWRVAFSGGRPFAVRAQAAAFVLVVVLAVGSIGGIAAVGAARLLDTRPTQPASPLPSVPTAPSARPTAPPSVVPSATSSPSITATSTPSASRTAATTSTASVTQSMTNTQTVTSTISVTPRARIAGSRS